MLLIRRWCFVVAVLAGLCACARTEQPTSHLAQPTGDAFTCDVEIRAEASIAGRRDVYRLVSATRYAVEPAGRIRVLARGAKAYRGDGDARPFAATPGVSSPVGTSPQAEGVDDARAARLAADGHALYVSALERRSRRATDFAVRLATPDGKVRDVKLAKTADGPGASWSGDGADASAGESAKPAMSSAPTMHLPAEVVEGIRAVSVHVAEGGSASPARVHLAIDFVWPALGEAPSRFELHVGPEDAAR